MYYRGAQAAIVVYDITSAESFEKAKSWITELQQQGSPNIVIAIAGNKADLAAQRVVQTDVNLIILFYSLNNYYLFFYLLFTF